VITVHRIRLDRQTDVVVLVGIEGLRGEGEYLRVGPLLHFQRYGGLRVSSGGNGDLHGRV